MTKAKLIDALSNKTGLTKKESQVVLEGFCETVVEALTQGESVEIRGFGSFRPQLRPARTARNPSTGATIQVPARRVPVFKASKELKDRVKDSTP
ncbi:MAG: integration host factor subunit beta [Bacteroidetes bacterium]|nr:integration host factor subunit beta [Bacteroidota bacterium]MCY4232694.1 integration host factor subunit beta [Bacteroidota bacterium]